MFSPFSPPSVSRLALVAALMLCAETTVRAEPTAETPSEPVRPPHPEPRVIVNVTSVRGPHPRAAVERSARFAWGRIVKCYKASDQTESGKLGLELSVSGDGKVTRARRVRSTLKDAELNTCLAKAIQSVRMPQARARSTAQAEIYVAPGNP